MTAHYHGKYIFIKIFLAYFFESAYLNVNRSTCASVSAIRQWISFFTFFFEWNYGRRSVSDPDTKSEKLTVFNVNDDPISERIIDMEGFHQLFSSLVTLS
jgi:hypothetical protein